MSYSAYGKGEKLVEIREEARGEGEKSTAHDRCFG